MGMNTTIVIHNDALHEIKDDKQFGRKIYDACSQVDGSGKNPIGFDGGYAIEVHHNSGLAIVATGGNIGRTIGFHYSDRAADEEILRSLADGLGFRLVRKKR